MVVVSTPDAPHPIQIETVRLTESRFSAPLIPYANDATARQPTPVKRLDLAFETVKQSALEDAPAMQVCPYARCEHKRGFTIYIPMDRPNRPIRPRGATLFLTKPNHTTRPQVILRVRPIPGGPESSCLALVPGTNKVQTTTPPTSVNFKILGEQVRRKKSGRG